MVKMFSSIVAVAAASSCSDDEAALINGMSAKDFGDKSNKCGTQALGLSGINHDKFNSCMKTEVGIDTACSECYAATADYGFKNCKAACLLGWCKEGCLSCTQPAQDDLPGCTGFEAAKADPCDSLESKDTCSIYDNWDADTCGEVQLDCSYVAPAKAFRSTLKDGHCADIGFTVAAGSKVISVPDAGDVTISWFKQSLESGSSCSADEQAMISGMSAKDFGDKSNKCGTQALGLSGINHDKFNSCMKTEVGIDTACSECYAATADYGFKNCKAACLLGWCKEGCLSCTQSAQDALPGCTGFNPAKADPCDSEVVV